MNLKTWGAAKRRKSDRLAAHFKIERGIPIPPARRHNGAKVRGITGVLRLLQRGESVRLPISQNQAAASADRLIGAGYYATRREGSGTRIWRTK
jgi:hypothetical protein